MQNLVVLMKPSQEAYRTPLKAGNMIFNRFCIDEDAAFELSGVYYLKKSSLGAERKEKGKDKEKEKDYLFLRTVSYGLRPSLFNLIKYININN